MSNKYLEDRAQVSVTGTMNGFGFQNSLLPQGDATHARAVSKLLQVGAKAASGDTVSMVMEVDRSERMVEIPVELKKSLAAIPKAKAAFDALSYSHREEFAEWVSGAKQAETRAHRAEKSVPMVLDKQHVR